MCAIDMQQIIDYYISGYCLCVLNPFMYPISVQLKQFFLLLFSKHNIFATQLYRNKINNL